MALLRKHVTLVKVVSSLTGAGALVGGIIWYYDVKPLRPCRVIKTSTSIMWDYRRTMRKFQYGTGEYDQAMSDAHTRSAHKLYDLCCINRGTYIKVGQILGALDYILPQEYTRVLQAFHDDAPRSTFKEIEQVIKEDLKVADLSEVFSEFSTEPLGTASLAQVHKAKLKSNGREVAVKVQHPKVREQANFDMFLMEHVTRFAAKHFPDFKMVWLAEETKKNLPRELDFPHEGRNAERVAQLLECFEWAKVPKIHWEISAPRVLVMELCQGGHVNDLEYFRQNDIDCNHISRLLGKMYSEMIFVHGFVHCDPHPGNVLVRRRTEDERKILDGSSSMLGKLRLLLPIWLGGKSRCSEVELVLLDHGLYQILDDDFRYDYAALWQGLIHADLNAIKKQSLKFGVGDLYPLFATMLTVRSWEVVSNTGIKNTRFSEKEDSEIRVGVPQFLPGISQILNTVPRPLILLFKTNDLLRMLEVLYNTRSDSSSFLNMSRCCLRALRDFDAKSEQGTLEKWRHNLALRFDLAKITVYEWYLWFQSILKLPQS